MITKLLQETTKFLLYIIVDCNFLKTVLLDYLTSSYKEGSKIEHILSEDTIVASF